MSFDFGILVAKSGQLPTGISVNLFKKIFYPLCMRKITVPMVATDALSEAIEGGLSNEDANRGGRDAGRETET